MAETVDLADVIRGAIESELTELRVALPGRVEKYTASTQRADVRLEMQLPVSDGEGGHVLQKLPVLPNVPVCFPQGGGGFFMSFPLQADDPVLVVFCDLPIGAWLQKAGMADPGVADFHGPGGAVCYPGLRPSGEAIADASASQMVLGKDGTPGSQVKLTGTEVHLGGGAQYVALSNLVDSRLAAIRAAFNAHQHTETGTTTGAPTSLLGAQSTVAAEKVKGT